MTRDPRIDPKPGDMLVFHDDDVPQIATVMEVGADRDDMVVWHEGFSRHVREIEEWPEMCVDRHATVLEGDGPLAVFRWRPGGARGGEMPEVGTWLLCLWLDSDKMMAPALTASWNSRTWNFVEWYVPIEELIPEDPTP